MKWDRTQTVPKKITKVHGRGVYFEHKGKEFVAVMSATDYQALDDEQSLVGKMGIIKSIIDDDCPDFLMASTFLGVNELLTNYMKEMGK